MSFLSSLMNALPGAAAQGLAWGIMAIGVYITFRILDVADLTVDGSLATGGAVCVMLIRGGFNPWIALLCAMLAGMLAGLVTGLFHTRCGIPAILAGILTQLALYSINLRIMDSKANQALSVDKYPLLLSQRYVRELSMNNPLPLLLLFTAAVIAILYWFFGTEKGSSLRATGANPHMARAQGINTNSNIVLGLMVSSPSPARCWRSIRARATSTWAAAPSSSALPPSSSARSSSARSSRTSASRCWPFPSARSSTTSCSRSCCSSV